MEGCSDIAAQLIEDNSFINVEKNIQVIHLRRF